MLASAFGGMLPALLTTISLIERFADRRDITAKTNNVHTPDENTLGSRAVDITAKVPATLARV